MRIQTWKKLVSRIARKCNGLPLAAKALGGLLGCNVGPQEMESHIEQQSLGDIATR